MSNLTLFDFLADPNAMLQKATRGALKRQSGTIENTVRHAVIHTDAPDATLHHTIIGACPHPTRERAIDGEYYMVAYVSIPLTWLETLTTDFARTWDVSFVGPAGLIQRIPRSLDDIEELLGDRVYIGFDWLWVTDVVPKQKQYSADRIKDRLVDFVKALRSEVEKP